MFAIANFQKITYETEYAGGGDRTHTILRSLDFESSASASSATPAAKGSSYKIETGAQARVDDLVA